MKTRIFDVAAAKTSSERNLPNQYPISWSQFASPSAELKRVCNTSPPKLWHILSNICYPGTYQFKEDSL